VFEFGFALLAAIFIAALMIVFRRLRSLKTRLDRLVLDHNILANRALLFTLNRVQAEPIVSPTLAPSIAPDPNLGSPQLEIGRSPIIRRVVGIEGAVQSEPPSGSPPFPGREPRRYQ
jgi:hypothetical protein